MVLLTVERDTLLPGLGLHGLFIHVVLSDINVSLPLELPHLHPLVLPQVPAGLLFTSGALGDGPRGLGFLVRVGVLLGSFRSWTSVVGAGVRVAVGERPLLLLFTSVGHCL